MSNVCCNAFKGWCKSFTTTEKFLTLLEALFIIIFITFLTIAILHLIACFKSITRVHNIVTTPKSEIYIDLYGPNTTPKIQSKEPEKRKECTWTPSHKTEAYTHYFDVTNQTATGKRSSYIEDTSTVTSAVNSVYDVDKLLYIQQSDGAEADNDTKGYVMALVKIKPTYDVTFGCTLTIISNLWTVTAASCIESIEEVDTLDSFVMMEGLGERSGSRIHAVSDVMIHPNYQGSNTSYDLCALKSEDNLILGKKVLELPTMIDYFFTTVGEKLTILGFGKYRSVDTDLMARIVRTVPVFVMPRARCVGEEQEDSWAPRHLEERGTFGEADALSSVRDLCVGGAANGVCRYCAGTPLLRARTLLAVMADWRQCALTCSPAPYVSLAPHVPWLRSLDVSI